MWNWVRDLDHILRGEATRLSELRDETIRTRAGGISVLLVVLGMLYGVCMGCFAVVNHEQMADRLWQLLATTLKVPALFFLTLLVTFPSLYVFNALVGTRLTIRAMLRLLIASLAVNLAVLASLGPIVAFFSISTSRTGYGFMIFLNVMVFALSGVLGLTFLVQTLNRLNIARWAPTSPFSPAAGAGQPAEPDPPAESEPRATGEPPPSEPGTEDEPADGEVLEELGALEPIEGYVLGRHVKKVFGCWTLVFAVVGAQMGWVLRPFVGSPDMPFEWFRERESNFFEALSQTLQSLF
jgi:hypothetical protein